MIEPKNEYERGELRRYNENKRELAFFDAAADVAENGLGIQSQDRLQQEVASRKDWAVYARRSVSEYEQRQAMKAAELADKPNKLAALQADDLPAPKGRWCRIHVYSGERSDMGGHQCQIRAAVVRPVYQEKYGRVTHEVPLCKRHAKDLNPQSVYEPRDKYGSVR